MNFSSYAQRKAVIEKLKYKWLAVNHKLSDNSGIYILTRKDEHGVNYCYVGQALHILTRLAEHLIGYQHIDLSLKKHGLYTCDNPYGWSADFVYASKSELDEAEQKFISIYLSKGYQMRNKTLGGQGEGKYSLDTNTTPKGYYDGKKQGYEDCRKYVKNILSKYIVIAPKCGKLPLRKYNEFMEFLENKENIND